MKATWMPFEGVRFNSKLIMWSDFNILFMIHEYEWLFLKLILNDLLLSICIFAITIDNVYQSMLRLFYKEMQIPLHYDKACFRGSEYILHEILDGRA